MECEDKSSPQFSAVHYFQCHFEIHVTSVDVFGVLVDENPVCQSNIKPQGFIGPNICGFEPDTLHLTCSVQYHGNQPPMMQWKEVGSDKVIVEGATRNASVDRVFYYVKKMEVNSRMDGLSYQCVTTRSTTSQYGCTTDIVSVKSCEYVHPQRRWSSKKSR